MAELWGSHPLGEEVSWTVAAEERKRRGEACLSAMGLRAQGSSSPSLSMASRSALMCLARSFNACLKPSCSFSAISLTCLQYAQSSQTDCSLPQLPQTLAEDCAHSELSMRCTE